MKARLVTNHIEPPGSRTWVEHDESAALTIDGLLTITTPTDDEVRLRRDLISGTDSRRAGSIAMKALPRSSVAGRSQAGPIDA